MEKGSAMSLFLYPNTLKNKQKTKKQTTKRPHN